MDASRPPLPYLDELKLFSKPPTPFPSEPVADIPVFETGIKILGIIAILIICAFAWNYFSSEKGRKQMDKWTSQLLLRLYLTDRGELHTIV